jgi:3',5'-nucleoside bisphosphate phosphatase
MVNKNKGLCDLHIHSIFSDSDADMASIFNQAVQKQLRCIAITDHDTVSGLRQARTYSEKFGIELIDGIEFSAQHIDREVHVLGYFIDPENKMLIEELGHIKDLRYKRLRWMADKLTSLGLGVSSDELFSQIGDTIPTRLHLAIYLVKKNIVKSLKEAFRKYLSPGKPAYKSRFKHSVSDTAKIIKKAGGVSVLAHPHIISQQSLVEDFIASGVEGLEVVYPSMSAAKSSVYRNLAAKHNLLKSGGSDAHGSYKEFTAIGDVGIDYSWVQEMKDRL